MALPIGRLRGKAVGYGVMRRRKRDEEDAVDEFFRHDDSGTTEDEREEEPMPDVNANSEPLEQLCDHLFNGDADADFWSEPLESSYLAPRDEPNRRLDATHGSSTATPLHNIALGRAERGQPRSAALGIERIEPMNPEGVPQIGCFGTESTVVAQARRVQPRRKPQIAAKKTNPKLSRRIKVLGALGVFAWLFLSAFALHKGLTPRISAQPINDMNVGTIVPPDKIHGDGDLLYGEKVNPKTWRHLFVEGKNNDGSKWDADLLVPLWWIDEQKAKVGGQVYISVPECGIDGDATVVKLGPCPYIRDLDGRVVTGVFRHHSAHVLDLRVEGVDGSIGTTANHPFFSVDRATFVRADSLEPGEQLRLIDGSTASVLSLTPRAGTHTVYNLQVSVDHVYHVTAAGVLVHNGSLGYWLGQHAEDLISEILQETEDGLRFLGSIQNKSGHGIDIVFQMPGGSYVFYEVKANSARKSVAQSDMQKFVMERLRRAEKVWKSVDPRTSDLARRIRHDILSGAAMTGVEIRVDLCTGVRLKLPWN